MTVKPARAPSEAARALIKVWGERAINPTDEDIACDIDDFAAHRLSTALLNPSEEVVEAIVQAFDRRNVGPKAVRDAFRAAAMKIIGSQTE